MKDKDTRSISELLEDRELITAAITKAVREAILKHAQAGHPIAVSEKGEVVWIPAEQILAKYAQQANHSSTENTDMN